MDIRTLKNFMKIAEYGSICRAAESLHIAQPPLSRQLKVLEDELGTKLFERSWVIGQKVLIKTAVAIEISMAMAVLSCF